MKKDSRYIWYAIDTALFLAINIFILSWAKIHIETVLFAMRWPAILILSLGVYRLTDVITKESVTDFIRAPFAGTDQGFRGFFAVLLSCNACMGVWVAMIVFYMYVFFPVPTLAFMTIMTLTGFERFYSKLENLLAKKGH